MLLEYKKSGFPKYNFDLIDGRELYGTHLRSFGDVDDYYLEVLRKENDDSIFITIALIKTALVIEHPIIQKR